MDRNQASVEAKPKSWKKTCIIGCITVIAVIALIVFGVMFIQKKRRQIRNDNASSMIRDRNDTYYGIFSHNDYDQQEPLTNAIDLRVGFIEIDVCLDDGELKVSHFCVFLGSAMTIQEMYLDPIKQMILDDTFPYTLDNPLYLSVDMKSGLTETLNAINDVISNNYGDIVTYWVNGTRYNGTVNIVLSGYDNLYNSVKDMNPRYLSVDGRIDIDILNDDISNEFMPIISQGFSDVFTTFNRLTNKFTEDETNLLKSHIDRAALMQKRLRYWATPENEIFWGELLENDPQRNVITINTDYPDTVRLFLDENNPNPDAAHTINIIHDNNIMNNVITKFKEAPMMIHIAFGILIAICLTSILCIFYDKYYHNSGKKSIKYEIINDVTSSGTYDTNDSDVSIS